MDRLQDKRIIAERNVMKSMFWLIVFLLSPGFISGSLLTFLLIVSFGAILYNVMDYRRYLKMIKSLELKEAND